ncbi:MAG: single-stranded DNA-binding protein [Phycisphaerae bacterium]|jgi:single-strand DNA-binding protein|nr:single-stranded DNA-binding protein [Phycisphaerae bacterium]MDP7636214.1 single-stranded DNA-binding protein [Phycisphaerae bacterium]
MANYNKVILAGNLTRDPQLSYTPSQTPVVDFGMAINRRWRGQDGQQREETCFVDCRSFGRQAEVLNQYMSKGRPILVEGRLNFSQWEGKDGQKRSKLRVIVEQFQFLGAGRAGGQGASQAAGDQPAAPPATEAPQNSGQETPPPEFDEGGEGIPF